ncbi:hypothetical protein Ancab_023767 [Ancistrocladus abbreviatus]
MNRKIAETLSGLRHSSSASSLQSSLARQQQLSRLQARSARAAQASELKLFKKDKLAAVCSFLKSAPSFLLPGFYTVCRRTKRMSLSLTPLAQMRKAMEISFVPSELWTQVFVRLPVKDLLKFRCVCKEWRSIIDSPNFVSLHLTHSKNNSDDFHLLLVGYRTGINSKWMLRRTDTFRKAIDLPQLKFDPYCITGYVNGLLLIDYELYGRQIITLCSPLPSLGSVCRLPYVQVGLGHDCSRNDHRVVVIAYSRHANDAAVPDVWVEMFSLNTSCWKSIACGAQHPSFGFESVQMFVKGAIYWKRHNLRVTYLRKDYQILSFDVVDEMWVDFYVAVLDSSLAILDTFKEQQCIWELDKHGVDASWTKQYTIDLQ